MYGGGVVDWKRGSAYPWNYQGEVELTAAPHPVSFASGCALMLRRKAVKTVGGFDPRFFMYEEDVDLSLRLLEAGFPLIYVPAAIVLHRVQGSTRKHGDIFRLDSPDNPRLDYLVYYLIRNRLFNMHKHARGVNRLRFLSFFPALWSYKLLNYARHGRYDAIRAVLRGFADYRKMRNRRCIDEVTGYIEL